MVFNASLEFLIQLLDFCNISTQKSCCFHCNAYLNKAFFLDLEILLRYSPSDVIVVLSNPFVGPCP